MAGFRLGIDKIHSASRVWTCGTMYYILIRDSALFPNKFGLPEIGTRYISKLIP